MPRGAKRGPRNWFVCGLCGRKTAKILRRHHDHLQAQHGAELVSRRRLEDPRLMRPDLLEQWRSEWGDHLAWLVGDKLYAYEDLVKEAPAVA